MRGLIFAVACLLLTLSLGQHLGKAALNLMPARAPALELVVFEHSACTYCRAFRRDLAQRYRQAVREDAMPLRFVDIGDVDTGSLGLRSRIDTLPTAVLMRDGREVDRIAGYWGPDNFFKLLSHILARME